MSEELEELEDDINHDWWTVTGFGHEAWQRYAGHFDCISAQMAEDLAKMECKEDGWTLAVTGVFEGKHYPADNYATWVDPEARSDDDMKDRLRRLGYIR